MRSLVGNPLLNDNILYGIPVCAPYVAMQDYKVKVKLLPGTTKRGKAAKACFQVFLKEKGLTASERDVLKSVKVGGFSYSHIYTFEDLVRILQCNSILV